MISVTRLLIHHCNAMHWKIYLITCKTLEMLYFTAQLCLVLFALPYNISTAHVQFKLYNCGLHSTSAVWGCSHITSAKIRGSWTPLPPSVSNGQHLAYPPSPPCQLSSAFARHPFSPAVFYVDLFTC